MKNIRVDLPEDLHELAIYPLADFHLGDSSADFELIKKLIDTIAREKNAYCILGGDLMDAAIASSVGDTYGANIQPMEQLKLCVKLFEPIKDKILCVLGGNHEDRIYKADGIDMTALMAAQLDISDRYSATTALLFIRFGHDAHHNSPFVYTLYAAHGAGGGRKEGGKINRLVDLAQIVDADVYVMGHTHQPAVIRNSYYRTNLLKGQATLVDRLFVNTASALRYGGYGDKQGYRPASNAYPVIYLKGTGRTKKADCRV